MASPVIRTTTQAQFASDLEKYAKYQVAEKNLREFVLQETLRREIDPLKQELSLLKESQARHLENALANAKFVVTSLFCGALGLEKPKESDTVKINEYCQDYFKNFDFLANDSLTIISMTPFEEYFSKNKESAKQIFKMNFTPVRAVSDPKVFLEFMHTHQIKGLGLDPCLKDIIDPAFEQLPVGKRTFKIVYVPRTQTKSQPVAPSSSTSKVSSSGQPQTPAKGIPFKPGVKQPLKENKNSNMGSHRISPPTKAPSPIASSSTPKK